jgi:hypothetical protein
MMRSSTRMERQVLSAFRRACAGARWDAAEMLLRALEALEPAPQPGSPLDRAYRAAAGDAWRATPSAPAGRSRRRRRTDA